jgi:hypothetical protein
MQSQRSPEQALRRTQASVVLEFEISQRQQVSPWVAILIRVAGLGAAKPLLELVDVAQVRTQRLTGRRIALELEPVAEREAT